MICYEIDINIRDSWRGTVACRLNSPQHHVGGSPSVDCLSWLIHGKYTYRDGTIWNGNLFNKAFKIEQPFHNPPQGIILPSYIKGQQPSQKAQSTRTGSYQLGSFLPSLLSFSMRSKNSSTEWPMLTGGSSRWLLVTALMRRSCEKAEYNQNGCRSSQQTTGKIQIRTFSNIFANGPPPPSPFPKTRRDASDDSRF